MGDLDSEWADAAAELGAVAARGLLGPTFTATVDGVVVEARSMTLGAYKTQLTARVDGAAGLTLKVHGGHVYPPGCALGIQDLEVGDPMFDEVFIVKSKDADYVRLWLDGPTAVPAGVA